jgi:hypothetical protein
MRKSACAVLSALILTACANSTRSTAELPDVNPSPAGPGGVLYMAPASTAPTAPMQQYTYVFPDSQNACAPEPQRFVAASGAVTYRVKNCAKDEYDYFPESHKARVDSLVEQCRARCGATATN